MRGGEFFDQAQHVIVTSADDAVTLHFGALAWSERAGDGVIVHVQANVKDRSAGQRQQPCSRAAVALIGG